MRSFYSRLKFLAALVALLLLAPQALVRGEDKKAAPATQKSFMWKVSSPTATVYMFGSIHGGSDDMYPLPKEVEEAFEKSAKIYLEVDISNMAAQLQMSMLMMQKGMYPKGQTLTQAVGKENVEATKQALKGLPNKLPLPVDQMRPWLAGMMVQAASAVQSGLDMQNGIEMHFIKEKGEKPVGELESAVLQVDVLSGLSDDLQKKFLESSLKQDKEGKAAMEALKNFWKSGDADGMAAALEKPLKEDKDQAAIMDKMLFDRNPHMADKIEEFLKGDQQIFVVVGAAHFVGDKGIVKLLEKKGHKVEQVMVTPPPATEPAER